MNTQERKPYQPKTGQKCHCRRGVWRDNCPECEGTGWRIDFRSIRHAVKAELQQLTKTFNASRP